MRAAVRWLAAFALLVPVAVGGCAGGRRHGTLVAVDPVTAAPSASPAPAYRAVPAACDLVTPETISLLLRGSVAPALTSGERRCSWGYSDVTTSTERSLTVEIARYGETGGRSAEDTARAELGSSRWTVPAGAVRATGVGDEALLGRDYGAERRGATLLVRVANVIFRVGFGSADAVLDRPYRSLPMADLESGVFAVAASALRAIGPVPAGGGQPRQDSPVPRPGSPGAISAGPGSPGAISAGPGSPGAISAGPGSPGVSGSGSPAASGSPAVPGPTGQRRGVAPVCATVRQPVVGPLVPGAGGTDVSPAGSALRSRCVWQQLGTLPASELWVSAEVAAARAQTGEDADAVARALLDAWRTGQPAQAQPATPVVGDEALVVASGSDGERTVVALARRGALLVEVRYRSGSGTVDRDHPALPADQMLRAALTVAKATLDGQG